MLHTLVTYRTDAGREIEGTREHAALVTRLHDATPGKEVVSLTVFPHSKHCHYKHFIKRGTDSEDREHFEPLPADSADNGMLAALTTQLHALVSLVEDQGKQIAALSPITPVAPVDPVRRKPGRPKVSEAA